MGQTGELALIQQIRSRSRTKRKGVQLGIGDDCAILQPPLGDELLVTTDFSLEGRHFRLDWHSPVSIGHRCLARGLSDIAAMGGRPLACFLSLALPARFTSKTSGKRWVDGFFEGLLGLAGRTGTTLAGGDTASSPGDMILADIVVLGSAPAGTALRRSGARAGDALYVTGSLGGSAAELESLRRTPKRFRQASHRDDHPHLFPVPRLQQGEKLRAAKLASAAIDVSDGLSTDLRHLCEESGVGAVVDASALPLHALLATLDQPEALRLALHGGEEYELLIAARPGTRMPRRIGGVSITRIGIVTQGNDIILKDGADETPLRAEGWQHNV